MSLNQIPEHIVKALIQRSPDEAHIQLAFEYYHQQYLKSDIAQQFVLTSPLLSEALRANVFIGVCDRTMGKHIAPRRSFEGGAIRGCLQRYGIVRPSGHELFRGCVIFPVMDDHEQIISAVGFRYRKRIRRNAPTVVHWNKPTPEAYKCIAMATARGLIYDKA
ncbi:hypothetical protein [Parashewanella tropica]|uniref:hypothetical protein n=1 Tax=Parashewanella tropica TaxID=2547970 RepID=UPI0010599618|nr:hypothetical protein [Parashewanella tropica]